MSKRLWISAAALAALWAVPSDGKASSFGLTYSRQCSSCGFCVRPYNAFSSVTCGVANVNYPGCGLGCNPGFAGLNPKCCGHGGCGLCCRPFCGKLFCGSLRGRVFGMKDTPIFPEEGGAFGNYGDQIAFFGQPAITNGYNPGCQMAWTYDQPAVYVPGHTPPPGPFVQPPNASCSNVWLPPRPFPGMYGVPAYPYYPMPYYPYGAERPTQYGPRHGRNLGGTAPASYQQPQDAQGNYQPASWWYPGYGYGVPQQGWYVPGYNGQ